MESRKLKIDQTFKFIKAGNSLVTFKSIKTGKHFTFKIKKCDDKNNDLWFVSVLYNPTDSRYTYIGMITSRNEFKLTKGSKVNSSAPSFKCFDWTWRNIMADSIDESIVEIWHEGRCGKCGRTLTDPESIEFGFGPVCRGRI